VSNSFQYAAQGTGTEIWWPAVLPSANLGWTYDASPLLAPFGDSIATVTATLKPGDGASTYGTTQERAIVDLGVAGDVITVQMTLGVAGRIYETRLLITGNSGRVWEVIIKQRIPLEGWVPTIPTPIVSAPALQFNVGDNSQYCGVI
jgi:hypothetical protein